MEHAKAWHHFTVAKTLQSLQTTAQGLSAAEAAARLKHYGANALPRRRRLTPLKILLNQVKSPLVWILFLAAAVSFALGEHVDALFIFIIVLINTVIGFIQENKANNALEKLQSIIHYQAQVIRDGRQQLVDTHQLVPGDIIALEAGNKVPADARLIDVHDVQVVEAALTGESSPSTKNTEPTSADAGVADRENMVYMGTAIARGRAMAVVVGTGQQTEIGHIASLVQGGGEEETPLQYKLRKVAQWLAIMVGVLTTLLFTIGLLRGREAIEMFVISVAVAVAAIPEGLVVALTVILVIGMQKILRQQALVRRLIAAETLGGTTVICTDKTGTLTEGTMRVAKFVSAAGKVTDQLEKPADGISLGLQAATLCNDSAIQTQPDGSQQLIGDTTEQAFLIAAEAIGMDYQQLRTDVPRVNEIPFNSEQKYMATLHAGFGTGRTLFVKGAPEVVLGMTGRIFDGKANKAMTATDQQRIAKQITALGQDGLRVLAVAYKPGVSARQKIAGALDDLVLIGLFALADPLRQDSKETIATAQRAGIRPVMITGDHLVTAISIAKQLGLPTGKTQVYEGSDLDALDERGFAAAVKRASVFARVEPRHKMRIVQQLQQQGEVVAMTGDGVNDAPALKAADIGVAVGSGTDVAKETADLVLLNDAFSTIVSAIRGGRAIFDNIRKVVLYLLSGGFSELILIAGAIIVGLPLPVLAVQILWVNIVEDGLPALALAADPEDPTVMQAKPRGRDVPIIDRNMTILIASIAIFSNLVLVSVFWWLYHQQVYSLEYIRTIMFIAIAIDSVFFVFACRSLRQPIWRYNPFANWYLNGAIMLNMVLMVAAVYAPFLQSVLGTVAIDWQAWVWLVGFGVFNVIVVEVTKQVYVFFDRFRLTA